MKYHCDCRYYDIVALFKRELIAECEKKQIRMRCKDMKDICENCSDKEEWFQLSWFYILRR